MSSRDDLTAGVLGALAGLAVGDALGAPVEGLGHDEISARYPDGLRAFAATSAFRRGEVTDDTEMALFVADSLIEHRGLDMDDVAARLIAWKDAGGIAGPSTSRGVEALREGVSWRRSGSTASASSGCLPRCLPIALALPPELVTAATLDCCGATHRHPQAIAASVGLNAIATRLVGGESWESAIDESALELAAIEGASAMKAAIRDPGGARAEHDVDAVGVFAQAFAAVGPTDTAVEAIVAAVAAGGDTDTAGAVAGALAGARWGVSAIDEQWISQCESGDAAITAGRGLAELRADTGSR